MDLLKTLLHHLVRWDTPARDLYVALGALGLRGFDGNIVSIDPHLVCWQRQNCGERECFSGSDVKVCTVPRADYAAALELSLIQRAAIVRADIFDRVKLSVNIAEQHRDAVYIDSSRRPRRNIRASCERSGPASQPRLPSPF